MASSQEGMNYKKREINDNVKKMMLYIGDMLYAKGFRSTMVREKPTAKSNVRLLPEPVRMAQSTVSRFVIAPNSKRRKEAKSPLDLIDSPIDFVTLEKVCQLLGMQPRELFKDFEFDLDETLSLDHYKGENNEQENQ